MNTLTIDIGNSRIKLDYWADEGIISHGEYENFPFDKIKKEIADLAVKGMIISSVRKDNCRIIGKLKEISTCDTIVDFNQKEIEKYKNRIKYQGNIGSDRIAAFLGAESFLPQKSKLIIDAGTAITLDIADNEGYYRGGNISLGLFSRMKDLAKSTDLLPEINQIDVNKLFGDDTRTAIMAGAKNGVVGEIIYTINCGKRVYNIDYIVCTGGDYLNFYGMIDREFKNCLHDEYLVGRGLNWHLRKFYFPEVFSQTKFFPSL